MLQADKLVGIKQKFADIMYTDTCSIYNQQKIKVNNKTKFESVLVVENEPCRLSYDSPKIAVQTESSTNLSNNVKLFISPDIEVVEGSRIEVVREGKTYQFKCSGMPSMYPTHQEIKLELSEVYA